MQRAGIFIPWPVIEPLALALEEWSLDCWTTREVPILSIFLYNSLLLIPPLHGQTNLWNVMQSKASQEGAFFLSSVTVTPSLPMILTDPWSIAKPGDHKDLAVSPPGAPWSHPLQGLISFRHCQQARGSHAGHLRTAGFCSLSRLRDTLPLPSCFPGSSPTLRNLLSGHSPHDLSLHKTKEERLPTALNLHVYPKRKIQSA